MKKPLFQKLTALVLALAMTLSLAGTAFAEELTQDTLDSSAAESALPAEDSSADTDGSDASGAQEEQSATDTTDPAASTTPTEEDTSAPATDPADDPSGDTDPADGSGSASADGSASDSSEDVLVPESSQTLGWVLVSDLSTQSTDTGDGETAEESESAEEADADTEETVTTSSTGEETITATASTHYEFHYKDGNGSIKSLSSGYYELPELTVNGVTYQSGIYYFNSKGCLAQEENIDTPASTMADKQTAATMLISGDYSKTYGGGKYATIYHAVSSKDYTLSTKSYYRILAVNSAYLDSKGNLTTTAVDPTVSAPYRKHTGRVQKSKNLWCVEGVLYSGFWRCSDQSGYDTRLYWVKSGVAALYLGKMDAASATKLGITAQYYCNGVKQSKLDGKVYSGGNLYSGYYFKAQAGNPDYGYYSKGVLKTSVNGWYYWNTKTNKWSGNRAKVAADGTVLQVYYFEKGYALRNKNNIGRKSLGGSGYYYYTFKSDGQLVTNLFAYKTSYRSAKLRVVVSRKNHTTTIFAYNSKTKNYDIPCKSFPVATPTKSSRYPTGTYKLGKKGGWMNDQMATGKPLSKCYWFKYPSRISGSGILFHTSAYKKKADNAMLAHVYNKIGQNCTAGCIRVQVVNAKLLSNLAKSNKKVQVVLGNSSSNNAFDTMTLSYNFDYTGKVKQPANDLATDPTGKCKVW